MAKNIMTRKQRVWVWTNGSGIVYLSLREPEWHAGYSQWEPQSVDAGTGPHLEIYSGWLFPLFGIRVSSLAGNAVQCELPVLMERLPRFVTIRRPDADPESTVTQLHY